MKIERIFKLAYIGTEYLLEEAQDEANNAQSEKEIADAHDDIQMAIYEQNEILKIMMSNGFKYPGVEE